MTDISAKQEITTIRVSIDMLPNGYIKWHDFDCNLYIDCEKCRNLKPCLRLRKKLDELAELSNQEAKE